MGVGDWEWEDGQPQSYLALGLGSQEPWLPLGAYLSPKL